LSFAGNSLPPPMQEEREEEKVLDPPVSRFHPRQCVTPYADSGDDAWLHTSPLFHHFQEISSTIQVPLKDFRPNSFSPWTLQTP